MNRAVARPRPAPSGPPAPLSTGRLAARPPATPLWLCLGLPRLPLEVRSGGLDPDAARIVVDAAGRVVQASAAAADCGVAPGLPLNAALALCPGLAVLARDEAAEAATLARLAAWAGAFTSCVSLAPPAALLLELRGSLRLFGGLEPLRERIRDGLRATGHAACDAVAPTPLAALWLARAGDEDPVTELAALPGRLGPLRLAVTGWPAATLATLRGLGVASLADCLRLPRGGLTRRLGRTVLADLDRALGRVPDPRVAFRPLAHYRGECELAAESSDGTRLLLALQGLFVELEGFLRARQRAVSRLAIRLSHLQHPATTLGIGLVRPELEAAHFAALCAERLERLVLPAPVIRVALAAGPGEPLAAGCRGLFGDAPGSVAGLRLVERLRARLGPAAVHGLALADEHRPEQAWTIAEPGTGHQAAPRRAVAPPPEGTTAPRPAWLLETPQPLQCRGGRPWLEGELALERGPERIETGWWDGGRVARDYWVARSSAGARLWIYREHEHEHEHEHERRPGPATADWFLHGVFG